ncbi:MAG: SIS domain-containing protein, partial [Candidatus Levyibacteriota bacterium]
AAYIHGHALPSGDLKHYVITLMQKGIPVIVALSNDEAKDDVLSSISQVKARGALVYGIAPIPNKNFDYFMKVPETGETIAIMNLIPLQLLAYYMAVGLGNNVDRPRNIAKSVTVK